MKSNLMQRLVAVMIACAVAFTTSVVRGQDPLPSWSDGPAKKSIFDFVARVKNEGGPDFVPVAERIATFDNDGTLWAEQPMYFQMLFALDRVKALRRSIPSGRTRSLLPRCSGVT